MEPTDALTATEPRTAHDSASTPQAAAWLSRGADLTPGPNHNQSIIDAYTSEPEAPWPTAD